ncbi:MAG: NAD(+)/NADH kinase [Desulfovibrio sp.]|nr:NAD(+)/NADH kinase [Desulfovibrio sp.]
MQKALYQNILLICKENHQPAFDLAKRIQIWLQERGCSTKLLEESQLSSTPLLPSTMAIVLGGDGTMIAVGRMLSGRNIPIAGINFGRVGFLTPISSQNWETNILSCITGQAKIQSRTTLKWQLFREERLLTEGEAVNDLVFSHGSLARLICADICINEEKIGLVRCDGLIFSTAVGSSGYNASAGGPILLAKTNAFVFTPICPYLRSISPLVVPTDTVFTIRIEQFSTPCYLTNDGQEGQRIQSQDRIEVKARPNAVLFFGNDEIFLERLRTRTKVLEQTYMPM